VQWQVSTDGGVTFSNLSGATSTTLSFAASTTQNGNKYQAVFTNSGGSATTTAATLTVNSGPPPPIIYFSDGFESGNFSQWNLPSSDSTGQRTVQTGVVNSGTYAAAFTNSSGQYSYIYTSFVGGPQSQTFTKFSFRLSSTTTSAILAVGRNANGGNTWEIDYDGGHQSLHFYFWNSSGGVYSISSANQAIAASTWYSVEIQDTQTTTGVAQAWLNGVSVGSVSADLSNANPFARLVLYYNGVGTCYFDDVEVANVYN
jgi:hypothetical protein